MPPVWLSRWWTVIPANGNHGRSARTSASRSSRPRSHSRSRQMAVNDFEIEPIWKSVCPSTSRRAAGSAWP